MRLFPSMAAILPESEKGCAKVEHFEITEQDAEFSAMRAAFGHYDEMVEPGRYAKLRVNGRLMMTDTRMERESNATFARYARGDVLVAGLGLGMILHPVLADPKVSSVTVIEKYQDVIDIVAPTLASKKLTIVCADIFDWKPCKGTKWDVIYFDIWPDISTDALKGMATLHRRFGRRLNSGGWMDSWKRRELRSR